MIWLRALIFVLSVFVAAEASAAPPSSCAGKFVGTWQHSWTNVSTLTRDGQALCSGNPFCQQGTWTCNGNSLIYTNSAGTFTYELQSNGTAVYGSNVMTRIGAGDQSGSDRSAQPSTDQIAPTARKKLPPNCIDATGLPGYAPGAMRCENRTDNDEILAEARAFMSAARAAARYRDYTDQMQAAGQYTNAAEAFTKAGRTAEARQASLLAQQASADADRYQRLKDAEQARRNRPDGGVVGANGASGSQGDPNSLRNRLKKCMLLGSKLGDLKASDLSRDHELYDEQMKLNGCP